MGPLFLGLEEPLSVGYKRNRQVLSDQMEGELAKYLIHQSKVYFGLSTKEVRRLAFEFAVKNKVTVRPNWIKDKMATADWLTGFLKRNPTLSLRTPEATSLSRATSFNKTNVNAFFSLLEEVMDRYKFEPQDIYNVDEMGITTVQRPDRIIAKKGIKQVGYVTSGERGTLVTFCFAVSASGNSIPPMFLFPRASYRDWFVNNGPPGSIGSANPTGWMKENDFLKFLKHFVKHARSSQEKPVLLLLDNHESHLALQGITFCKENGVVVLSLPPHCSHKLQPLDRSVYGPLKKYINGTCDSWMRNHPGKTMSIYDIPPIARDALPLAATPKNIQAGFAATGIFPFNKNVFSDDEFLPAAVTDRPNPENELNADVCINEVYPEAQPNSQTNHIEAPSTPKNSPSKIDSLSVTRCADLEPENLPGPSGVTSYFSPEDLRPTPKAGKRVAKRKGRKPGRSAIWTDTPNKKEIEEKQKMKDLKEQKKKAKETGVKRNLCKGKGKAKAKTIEASSSSEDEDETFCLICDEPFSNSRPKEKWLQCTRCSRWAHEECTDKSPYFVCIHCNSDDDM